MVRSCCQDFGQLEAGIQVDPFYRGVQSAADRAVLNSSIDPTPGVPIRQRGLGLKVNPLQFGTAGDSLKLNSDASSG